MPLLSIALSQRSLSGSRYGKAVCFVFSVFIFFLQILLYPIHHIHPYIQHKLETIERVCVFGCVVCVCIHVQLLVCFLFLFTFVIFFSCLFSSIIHVRTTLLQHFRYIRTACMYTILSRSSLMPTSKQSYTHTHNVLLLGAVPYSPLLSVTLFSNRYRVFGRTHTQRYISCWREKVFGVFTFLFHYRLCFRWACVGVIMTRLDS